jgi:hypothetical protein
MLRITSRFALPSSLLSLLAACAPTPGARNPGGSLPSLDSAPYVACDDAAPCPPEGVCVYGICLPRCNGGDACMDGDVCWPEGCRAACDDDHPCPGGYSCMEDKCEADPCAHLAFWPLSLASARFPILIHYRDPVEADVARETMGYLEHSWAVETNDFGFEPPLPDRGLCGPDDSFDVFLWRGYEGGDLETLGEEPSTAWDDALTFLMFDPWGPYGGPKLDATTAHELNHAQQAVHDWNESAIFFEMTAQFIEDQVYPEDDGWMELLGDYQARPDWAFDFNDDYETWFFYGSALYLFYLRDAVFGGDPSFVSNLWRACRNPAGTNEPDFEDALDDALRAKGRTFLDSLVEFTRWRWYTAERDDGRHFAGGHLFPADSLVAIERRLPAVPQSVVLAPGPMMLGAVFVELTREPDGPEALTVDVGGEPRVRWSVQAVPGLEPGTDGEVLDLSAGPATLRFGTMASRTLVVLALPAGPDDPDERTTDRFPIRLTLGTVP